MLIPRPEDAVHKAWLYRLLIAIADDPYLTAMLRFKGGTCAAMQGFLNRFSVDLDFDFIGTLDETESVKKAIESHIKELGLEIKDQSRQGIQYFLRYEAPVHKRNTLKIDAAFPVPVNNQYTPIYLANIDRTLACQTIETMFANKLVAVLDRYEKTKSVAGRDFYDIHAFFLQGLRYHAPVIEERRKTSLATFFEDLITFTKTNATQTGMDQDLSALLFPEEFKKIRKTLIQEVIIVLEDELQRITTKLR